MADCRHLGKRVVEKGRQNAMHDACLVCRKHVILNKPRAGVRGKNEKAFRHPQRK